MGLPAAANAQAEDANATTEHSVGAGEQGASGTATAAMEVAAEVTVSRQVSTGDTVVDTNSTVLEDSLAEQAASNDHRGTRIFRDLVVNNNVVDLCSIDLQPPR